MMNISVAMILAAGKGTRMLGSINHPKSMICLNGKSLISYILNNLYKNGINKVVINTHYKASMLEEHVMSLDISSNLNIIFSREKELLDSAGGVINALDLIGAKEFFLINSDVYWFEKNKSAITQLQENWNDAIMDELLLLIPTDKAFGYRYKGDFDLGQNNQLIKGEPNQNRNFVYVGVSIVKRAFFDEISKPKISFQEMWKAKENKQGYIHGAYGIVFDGEWIHIGDPEGLKNAQKQFNLLNQIPQFLE